MRRDWDDCGCCQLNRAMFWCKRHSEQNPPPGWRPDPHSTHARPREPRPPARVAGGSNAAGFEDQDQLNLSLREVQETGGLSAAPEPSPSVKPVAENAVKPSRFGRKRWSPTTGELEEP